MVLTFIPNIGWAFNYVLGDDLYPYSTEPMPGKGASYVDTKYNTKVTRMTNSALEHGSAWGSVTEYSTFSPESSDGNWLVVEGISSLSQSSGYYLYTAAGGYVGSLSPYIQLWNGQEPEVRWDNSGVHPSWLYYRKDKQLRYYDVADRSDHLVHDFSADFPGYDATYFVWNGDEGNCSENSRYWAFMLGTSNTNIILTFTYDKTQDKVIASHPVNGHAPNNVFMSKSGDYVYVAYSATAGGGEYDGPHCYKKDYSSNVKICTSVPHAVPVYDAQGNEVIFFMNSTANFPDYVQFVRCDNGAVFPLYNQANLGWDSANLLHAAPGLSKKGWGFVSTYSIGTSHTSDKWDYNQIFAFELDETKTTLTPVKPRIWRVSYTQNFPASSYYYNQPNAAITNDGQRIYWGANWRDSTTGKMEVYRVDLPATWYQDFGGQPAAANNGTNGGNGTVTGTGTTPTGAGTGGDTVSVIEGVTLSANTIKVIGPAGSKGIINPNKGDMAKIYFKGAGAGRYECRVFSLTGAMVWETSMDSSGVGMFEWKPQDAASGGYVVYVKGPGLNAKEKLAIIK